jgi:hypothetical protein
MLSRYCRLKLLSIGLTRRSISLLQLAGVDGPEGAKARGNAFQQVGVDSAARLHQNVDDFLSKERR